jgi:hypothetical protein
LLFCSLTGIEHRMKDNGKEADFGVLLT